MSTTFYSPAEVCEELGIQDSTLRKYSLLLDKEGVTFERHKNNRRKYTETHVMTLKRTLELMRNDDITLETAIKQACKELKAQPIIEDKSVTDKPLQRNNDDTTALLIEEIRELRKEIKERDLLFVEALEKMQSKLDRMEEQQHLLIAPKEDGVDTADTIEKDLVKYDAPGVTSNDSSSKDGVISNHPTGKDVVSNHPQKKKGFFSRLFNKD